MKRNRLNQPIPLLLTWSYALAGIAPSNLAHNCSTNLMSRELSDGLNPVGIRNSTRNYYLPMLTNELWSEYYQSSTS